MFKVVAGSAAKLVSSELAGCLQPESHVRVHGGGAPARQKKLATNFRPQPCINWNHELAVLQWWQEKSSGLVAESAAQVIDSVATDK